MALIRNLSKLTSPQPPGYTEGYTAVVGGSASVPIELRMEGIESSGSTGVDLVFLIDNSGSMKPDLPYSDPEGNRFHAINSLSAAFAPTRDHLDRIAVIVFRGEDAVLICQDDPWKKWSEVPSLIEEAMQDQPDGATPMEVGINRATELLAAQNGFYKLVILLSDGLPTPDDGNHPQTAQIIDHQVPEAFTKRVLYSTVYLHVPKSDQPVDSALMKYIARHTDYITRYQHESDPPLYYFRIEDTTQMVDAYRRLFELINSRRVAQDVKLTEQVHPRLLIDPQFPPQFAGNGFDRVQNVIGTPLDYALQRFADPQAGGCFEITLNELKGTAVLRFAVKLNLETVTPEEYRQGYVVLPVDRAYPESRLSWLEPAAQAGSMSFESGLPQTQIKFELGLQVIKKLEQDGNLVNIEIHNLDQNPVNWFELFEYPSGFVNPVNFKDNLGFKPLEMLYSGYIKHWFLSLMPPGMDSWSRQLQNRFFNRVYQAHASFLSLAAEINELLGQFTMHDDAWCVDHSTFWGAQEVRGAYRLATVLPGKASRYLRFGVQDASFARSGSAALMLMAPIDALKAKEGDSQPSIYRTARFSSPREILPNPMRSQYAFPQPRPDLYLSTGLNEDNWKQFASLFRGLGLTRGSPLQWRLLDSPDITPFWQASANAIGVRVKIHNSGAQAPAGALLKVHTYFIPFTGTEFLQPYQITPPLVGRSTMSLPVIPNHPINESSSFSLSFSSLRVLETGASAQINLLQKVKKALTVTVVEIEPAEGEVMLANNRAIEVVPIECG